MRSATPCGSALGFDAVKHLVLCRIERRPPRLNLDVYPYLPRARVAMTSAKSYMSLRARRMTDTPQPLLAHHLKTRSCRPSCAVRQDRPAVRLGTITSATC